MNRKLFTTLGIIIVSCLTYFGILSYQLTHYGHPSYDKDMILNFRTAEDLSDPVGSKAVEEILIDMAAIGSTIFLTIISGSLIGFLLLIRRFRLGFFLLFVIGLGTSLSLVLKNIFSIPPPDIVPHLSLGGFTSYPSGHMMSACIIYTLLGILLSNMYEKVYMKIYFFFWVIIILTCVGVSRIYTGVHWPTDIFGGAALGIAWSLACWIIMKKTRLI